MTDAAKQTLHRYLEEVRDAVLWKLEGLSDYDVRRPLTPTGTNLLGLVKHLSIVEAYYFGTTFGRPFPDLPTWWDEDAEEGVDMWVGPDETRAEVLGRYQAVRAHADATIAALDLDAPGTVPWWRTKEVTLHTMLVPVLAEANRHAGHSDVLRETLDGAVGVLPGNSNVADHDAAWWAAFCARIEAAAQASG